MTEHVFEYECKNLETYEVKQGMYGRYIKIYDDTIRDKLIQIPSDIKGDLTLEKVKEIVDKYKNIYKPITLESDGTTYKIVNGKYCGCISVENSDGSKKIFHISKFPDITKVTVEDIKEIVNNYKREC
jgi:hypothetical protein